MTINRNNSKNRDAPDFGSGSGRSCIRPVQPNLAAAKFSAGFHFPNNSKLWCLDADLRKIQQSSLELGLKSKELNDDCNVDYSTFSAFCLLVCFCCWQISKCRCSQLSLIWHYATHCICSPQFPNLAPASVPVGFGKLESGVSPEKIFSILLSRMSIITWFRNNAINIPRVCSLLNEDVSLYGMQMSCERFFARPGRHINHGVVLWLYIHRVFQCM